MVLGKAKWAGILLFFGGEGLSTYVWLTTEISHGTNYTLFSWSGGSS